MPSYTLGNGESDCANSSTVHNKIFNTRRAVKETIGFYCLQPFQKSSRGNVSCLADNMDELGDLIKTWGNTVSGALCGSWSIGIWLSRLKDTECAVCTEVLACGPPKHTIVHSPEVMTLCMGRMVTVWKASLNSKGNSSGIVCFNFGLVHSRRKD